MKSDSVDGKSLDLDILDITELTRAPIWLKLLLFAMIGSGTSLCLAGFLLLSGQS